MTLTRAGYGAAGCEPLTNAERADAWRERMRAWVALQADPLAAEVGIGRQHAKGVALQKVLRKRKRYKFRRAAAPKPAANVTPIRRRA